MYTENARNCQSNIVFSHKQRSAPLEIVESYKRSADSLICSIQPTYNMSVNAITAATDSNDVKDNAIKLLTSTLIFQSPVSDTSYPLGGNLK